MTLQSRRPLRRAGSPSAVLGALLWLLLLPGCAQLPVSHSPTVDVPAGYKEAAPPGTWQPAQPADLQRGPWWMIFGDPTLDSLIADVDIGNQNLRFAEAQLRQARAAVDAARAGLYPSVVGGASASHGRQPLSNANTYNLSASASWEPDLWGRLRSSAAVAEARAQASEADLSAARLSARALLAQSYFQLRIADAQQKLLAETVASYKRSLQLTRDRQAAGVASRADVSQAQAQLKNAEAQRLDVGIGRAQLEHAIALLTGRAPAQLTLRPAPLRDAVPHVSAGLPSGLLERRPDIAANERRVAAANAQIGVARAAFFPALTLSASGGLRSGRLADWLSLPARVWSLGPALALTLFDAGARDAVSAQAIAAYDATAASYRQAVLTAFGEVEDNLASLSLLAEQESVQREALAAARDSLDIVSLQYKAGTVSYLNVIVAQATALQSERSVLDLRGRRLTATVALIKALGGAW